MRYYLEMRENGERFPVGDNRGYATLKEAKQAAKKRTDDALPRNHIYVMLVITSAYIGGDGGEYCEDETCT